MREPTAPRSHSLQAFQQRLSERMQQARREHAGARSCIAVATGARRWLFDLAHTAEMLTLNELAPVPFTRDWYLGLINHRSRLTGVIDLDAFAGASQAQWQAGDHLLALSPALPLHCAIRVTQIIGVVDRTRFRQLTPDPAQAAWSPQSFIDADGARWDQVDLGALMKTPAFLDIARR